ncbi:MAG: hypothetical protein ACFCUU_14605 [Cyclobacteriaceae bacterium]
MKLKTILTLKFLLLFLIVEAQQLQLHQPQAMPSFEFNDKFFISELPEQKSIIWSPSNNQQNRLIVHPEKPIKVTHLEIVHTFHPGRALHHWMAAVGLAHRKNQIPPPLPVVASYQVMYADSSTVEIPIRYQESIHNWYRVHKVGPMLWAKPEVVKNYQPETGEKSVVYKMEWPNPKPDQPIINIHLLADNTGKASYGDLAVLSVQAKQIQATGKQWFVQRQPFGNDANPGNFEEPFFNLQKAIEVAKPGDNIYIRGGYYALNEPVKIDYKGEKDKWLTISAWPGETPVLESYGIAFADRTALGVLQASGDPSYLRIQGLHIYHSRGAGISVNGKSETGSAWGLTNHVEVNFNTTYHTNTMGIIIHTVNDIKVLGNLIIRPHSIPMSSDPATDAVTTFSHGSQEAIDLSRNKGFEIAFNQVYGGSKEAIDCISIKDGSIHHNYVHDCLNGIYIDSWSVPIHNLDIHHNFIHNAFNGIPLATEGSNDLFNIDIHHNIIFNSKSKGIGVNEATYKAKPALVQKINVFQNTIDDSGGHTSAIGWLTSGIEVGGFKDNKLFKDIVVKNNIITNTSGRPISNVYEGKPEHNISITHNLIYPEGDSTPEWMMTDEMRQVNNYSVKGEKALVADPLYRDPQRGDFRLLEQSPAFGAGLNKVDLGALPKEAAWQAGLDWAGHVTAYYFPETIWKPLQIPREKFTMHRNHHKRPSWFQRNRYGADFQNLPAGDQAFAGVTFFIPDESLISSPTVLTLRGRQAEVEAEKIENIPIGSKTGKLAFLQAYHLHNKDISKGEQLFHFRINYADGSHELIPVHWQLHIEDWLSEPDQLHNLESAELAWYQEVMKKGGGSLQIRLYKMEWINPKPSVEIVSLDMINDREYQDGAPAVFAISIAE